MTISPKFTCTSATGGNSPPDDSGLRFLRFRVAYLPVAVALVCLITIARIVLLFAADYNLGPDEAQYWSWSRDLAFGYFSKPPMIAWLIGLTTGVLGDGEAAIRLSSPLLHMGTALVVFALARELYDDRIAFWSALVYATAPAVWFSSGLITTDVPLLLFWALAMLSFHRCLGSSRVGWAIALGFSIGLGLMSKYAMVYFLIGALIYLATSREHRWILWSRKGLLALLVAVVVFAPNIWWNLTHGLATVEHTAANANWGRDLFNPAKLGEFLGAQFGVFGPLLFGALLWGVATLKRRVQRDADVFLLSFVLPILVIVAAQALLSRANANWAAPAYVAAAILVVAWASRWRRGWFIIPSSVGLHTAVAALLCALILSPSLVNALGRSNDFKRVRGWETLGDEVRDIAANGEGGEPFTMLLTDDRLIHAELLYYARPLNVPAMIWNPDGKAGNHYELTNPFPPDLPAMADASLGAALDRNVLFVSRYRAPQGVLSRFQQHQTLDPLEVPIGGARRRSVSLFVLHAYRGP